MSDFSSVTEMIQKIQEQNSRIAQAIQPTFTAIEAIQKQQIPINAVMESVQLIQEVLAKSTSAIFAINDKVQQSLSAVSCMSTALSKTCESIVSATSVSISPAFVTALTQYANSIQRFTSQVNWEDVLGSSLNYSIAPNFEATSIDSWIDSASDILNDMSEQEWIDETEEKTIRSTFQDIKSTLLPAGKVIFCILNILALISTITGCNLINGIEQFERDSDKQVEVMPINNDDKKIIVAETELFNQVSDALMFSDDTPEVRKD